MSSSQINLAWTASTDNVATTGYKVFRAGAQIATVTAGTTYQNTGLTAGTAYAYTVSAFDAAGNNSAQGASVSATTQAAPDTTAPSVPTNLSATAMSASQINLAWTASTDNVATTGYTVFRAGAQIATVTAGTTYQNTGLTAGTAYAYTVSAFDAAGNNSAQSTAVSATTSAASTCVTSSVTGWQSAPFATQTTPFTVTYDDTPSAANMDGVTGLSLNAATGYSSLAVTTRFNLAGFIDAISGNEIYSAMNSIPYAAGQVYHFRVLINPQTHTYSAYVTPPSSSEIQVANNYPFRTAQLATASLNSWSLYSETGTHSVCSFTMTPGSTDTQAPSVPTGLSATAISPSQINLTWTASTDTVGVTGYKIFRNGAQAGTATTTSYSDTGLSAGTTYAYTVSAFDAAGNNSAQGASVSATTQAPPDTTAPSVPTNLSATAMSSSQINLAWTASTDNVATTGYTVFRAGAQIATVTAGTTYQNTGLTAGTAYAYTVSAFDAAGNNSAQGASVSATTQAPPDTTAPSVPTNLSATAISSSQINLAWTASTDNVATTGYNSL